MIPTTETLRAFFGTCLPHRFLKFCSRKNLEQLIQNAAKSLQGADSSSLIAKLGRFADRIQRVSPFFGPFLKT